MVPAVAVGSAVSRFYDTGPGPQEGESTLCMVGTYLVRLFPVLATVFAWFAGNRRFMQAYRPVRRWVVDQDPFDWFAMIAAVLVAVILFSIR